MNILIIIGIVLGGGTIAVDRFLYQLPNWLTITLFSVACIMIFAGMITTRTSAK